MKRGDAEGAEEEKRENGYPLLVIGYQGRGRVLKRQGAEGAEEDAVFDRARRPAPFGAVTSFQSISLH